MRGTEGVIQVLNHRKQLDSLVAYLLLKDLTHLLL